MTRPLSRSLTGIQTNQSSPLRISAAFSTLERCVCVSECEYMNIGVTPPIASSLIVLGLCWGCMHCQVSIFFSSYHLQYKFVHMRPFKFRHMSIHRLMVGRLVTAQKSYLLCVRRKERSENQRHRQDVPLRM